MEFSDKMLKEHAYKIKSLVLKINEVELKRWMTTGTVSARSPHEQYRLNKSLTRRVHRHGSQMDSLHANELQRTYIHCHNEVCSSIPSCDNP